MVTPQANSSPMGFLPRLRRFRVVGIFEIGVYEYDRSSALIHYQDASRLFRLDGGVSGIRLKLDDLDLAPLVRNELKQGIGLQYWVSDWTLRHSNYFKAVRTEKTVMFIILSLIVAVAAFNIVSTLVMVSTEGGIENTWSNSSLHLAVVMAGSSRKCLWSCRSFTPNCPREPGAGAGDE